MRDAHRLREASEAARVSVLNIDDMMIQPDHGLREPTRTGVARIEGIEPGRAWSIWAPA